MAKTATSSSSTRPTKGPTKADITSNEGSTTVQLTGGFVQLMYYESILQDSVKADYIFADAGNTINKMSAMQGLPIV